MTAVKSMKRTLRSWRKKAMMLTITPEIPIAKIMKSGSGSETVAFNTNNDAKPTLSQIPAIPNLVVGKNFTFLVMMSYSILIMIASITSATIVMREMVVAILAQIIKIAP